MGDVGLNLGCWVGWDGVKSSCCRGGKELGFGKMEYGVRLDAECGWDGVKSSCCSGGCSME